MLVFLTQHKEKLMPFELMKLPFEKGALKPYISEETLEYHYGKHHKAYVDKLNTLLGNAKTEKTLETLIKTETGAIFNNAAQIWNHDFYWQCLTPTSTKQPQGKLLAALNNKFGSFDEFKKQFKEQAVANFGSGWTWLVKNADGSIEILNTSNADNLLTKNKIALLTCDVWEHAYYIDYRNARATYLDNFWNIVNWQFVESNL
jgi:superoxide dismutase, Fe-Mn family